MTELPKGWVTAALGEVAEWSSGGTPRAGTAAYYGGDIPWAVIGDLNDGRVSLTASTITPLGLQNSSAKIVDKGTVLVAMYGSIGKLGISQMPMATNQAIACAVPCGAITRDWLFWWLRSQRHELLAAGKGGTQSNISQTVLKAWPIPIAPRSEQERIVTAIEEAFSKIDAGEAGLRTVRQLLRRMRDAILTAAVTGRLVPQGPTDTPAAKLLADLGVEVVDPQDPWSETPEGWCWSTIGGLVEPGRKVAYGVLQPGPDVEDGVPLVRVMDIGGGSIAADSLKRIAPSIAAKFPRTRLVGGEVLLTVVGTIGRVAVVPASLAGANVARAVAVLPLRSDVVRPQWIGHALGHGPWRRALEAAAHEVARKTLNLEDVRRFPVPVPPPEEQPRIIAEVERQLSFVDACERTVDVGLVRAAGLRRSVLKAAFEGRLVPQDPSDEPASASLDRIKAERSAQPAAKRPTRQTA